MNRRSLLRNFAVAGASAMLPTSMMSSAFGQESIWDMFARDRVLREADTAGATAQAQALIDTTEPILSYDTAYNLQLAISQYEPFVAAGGWEIPPQEVYGLKLGGDRREAVMLKRRLMSSGDMPVVDRVDNVIDAATDAAIRTFQARHGLLTTGEIDEPTFYAMQVPAETRLQQLYLNLQRVSAMAPNLEQRYVVVNIPAATIEAVEGGMVVQRHTAVVGRADRATPILKSAIHQINFNPYWHVPKSIVRADLTKYMLENPNYLTEQSILIYDDAGNIIPPSSINWSNISDAEVAYMYRQEPGAINSLGRCKINFENPYSVYLHDTPTQALFGENARFYSSGCVRVEGVNQLVAWILRENGYDVPRVDATFASGERLDVAVSNPVPIHTTYISAWANRQGTVSFRDDVYQFDAQGKVTFEA